MFAITKAGRARKDYLRAVRNHLVLIFSLSDKELSKQNKIWEEWLAVKDREYSDLLELLKSNVNDAYKARALAILLTPMLALAPFAWTGDKHSCSRNYLGQNARSFSGLSPALLSFVVELLMLNIDIALAPDADEKLRETLFVYNEYILHALAILPEDDPRAAELFKRFCINDPVAFWNMFDSESGYNPFSEILTAKLPEKWKVLADSKMREVILAEQNGQSTPREKWEDALGKYLYYIRSSCYRSPPAYSTALIASQVEFALGLRTSVSLKNISCHDVCSRLKEVGPEVYKELRHKLVRQGVLVDNCYSIYGEDDRLAFNEILEEFGGDKELADRLHQIIDECDARDKERSAIKNKADARVNAVLEQMR